MNEQQQADNEQQPVSDDHESASEEVHRSGEDQVSSSTASWWLPGLGVIVFALLKLAFVADEQSPNTTATYSTPSVTASVSGSQSSRRPTDNSQASSYPTTSATQNEQEDDSDPTGLYVFRNYEGETRLVVAGTRWLARTIINTGFGAEYDASQGMTSVGVVSDNILYDETGYVEVGSLRRIGRDFWVAELAFGGGIMRLRKQ